MAANILQEYLMSLGWHVDHGSMRKFDDALRHMSEQVERYTNNQFYGIVPKFAKAGLAITGVLGSIAAGTVGLLTHVANADLDFQVLARRMFMTTDAARQMKIATDALGYSLEDIIYGPQELRDRYHTLIQDQMRMGANLGPNWEENMHKIRDMEFQFTRFKVELQYMGMQLAGDIAGALFGQKGDPLENLKAANEWFQAHIPAISKSITGTLVPALQGAASAVMALVDGYRTLREVSKDPQGKLGGLWDKDKGFGENISDLLGLKGYKKDEIIGKTAAYGRSKLGPAGAADLLALFETESGFDPQAINKRTGAIGLGQVMPGNWPKGKRVDSVEDQISAAGDILFGNLARRGGNLKDALHDYYGWGKPGPGEPTFDEYYQRFMKNLGHWDALADPQKYPEGYKPTASTTHVTINVQKTSASAEEIGATVRRVVEDLDMKRNQRLAARLGGVYA